MFVRVRFFPVQNFTAEGNKFSLEGSNFVLEGKNLSFEGDKFSLKGRNFSSEGDNYRSEGNNTNIHAQTTKKSPQPAKITRELRGFIVNIVEDYCLICRNCTFNCSERPFISCDYRINRLETTS